jgi:uncharacterized OB-fold protein
VTDTVFDDRFRVPPALDDTNRFFWTSGADGQLRFLRCRSCGYWLHPPSPWCPECGRSELAPEPVSGRGVVHSATVNHQPWDGDATPYVVALVELDEQPGLRLTTNLVGVDAAAFDALAAIDAPVRVVFEQRGEVYYPLFELVPGDDA